ncbi:hypothetical protein [Nonomuraea rubra]|uniref:hypothetical protein n=1 Tax=Nonomuraea rubra TaxID=46180 RepID=UPI00340BEBA3
MVDDVPRTFGLDGLALQEKAGEGVEQIVIDRKTGHVLGRQCWLLTVSTITRRS